MRLSMIGGIIKASAYANNARVYRVTNVNKYSHHPSSILYKSKTICRLHRE